MATLTQTLPSFASAAASAGPSPGATGAGAYGGAEAIPMHVHEAMREQIARDQSKLRSLLSALTSAKECAAQPPRADTRRDLAELESLLTAGHILLGAAVDTQGAGALQLSHFLSHIDWQSSTLKFMQAGRTALQRFLPLEQLRAVAVSQPHGQSHGSQFMEIVHVQQVA
jgi:hypothetical protein